MYIPFRIYLFWQTKHMKRRNVPDCQIVIVSQSEFQWLLTSSDQVFRSKSVLSIPFRAFQKRQGGRSKSKPLRLLLNNWYFWEGRYELRQKGQPSIIYYGWVDYWLNSSYSERNRENTGELKVTKIPQRPAEFARLHTCASVVRIVSKWSRPYGYDITNMQHNP